MSLFFGLSVFGFAIVLQCQEKNDQFPTIISNTSRILFLLGTILILVYGILEYILPLSSITAELYTISSFIFALGILIFDSKRKEFAPLAFTISAIIFLLMTSISFLEPKILLSEVKSDWMVDIHIGLSILSAIFFVASFCASLLFVISHNNLKRKIIEFNSKSTSLSTLEIIIIRSSFAGLAFITLALITGIILVFVGKNILQVGLFKIFWAFFVWAWYVMTIFGRSFWGWKGRKGAWLIIIGSILLILGLLANIVEI